MIISYDFGHMEGGKDISANGIVYEYAEIRKYAPVCIAALEGAGHQCINCTPPDGSGMSVMDSLAYRVNKANESGSQLHICFHVNAFDGSAHGAEIEVASDNGEKYAIAVLNEIVALGLTKRGINRPSLYVTKHTNMPAILIEPFFCDSQIDVNLYDPTILGNAIAKGIIATVGGSYSSVETQKSEASTQVASTSSIQYDVEYLQHELNVQCNAGLSEDNNAGPLTRAAASRVILRQGASGNITRWVQANVGVDIDGSFGPVTLSAIQAFQNNHGLSADGIVGANTWNALLG